MKKTVKYLLLAVSSLLIISIILMIFWNSQPYYKKYRYVAHALGGIDNQDYTNSKEALEHSYSIGHRVMEVDLLFTSDGHLVGKHNWEQKVEDGLSKADVPDYDTFMSSKINGKYSPVDIETIIQFAMQHPDVYFVTDSKSSDLDIYKIAEVIVNTSKSMGYTEYERQFVIQFYNYDEYEQLRGTYGFQNYIFTLYRMKSELKENGLKNILDFCIAKNIKVVTLPKNYVTEEICESLSANGITVFAHTVDNGKKWNDLMRMGVDGIYTNYIIPPNMYYLCGRLFLFAVNSFVLLLCLVKVLKYRKELCSHTLISWSVEVWE